MIINGVHALNKLLVANLERIRQLDFDVIVHLPRSGTIPASLLATYLKRPFASVDEYCAGIVNTRKAVYETLHKILIVDDSIATGGQLKNAMERIMAVRPETHILSLCVYGVPRPDRVQEATMVLSTHRDKDYVYPWFLWKTANVKHYAFDMDGVLCRECSKEEDDEGANYKKFIAEADLKFHTDFELGAIITGRLEKYRPQTEAWLQRHGFKYRRLIMGPWKNNAQRREYDAARWKAKEYKKSKYTLFVESSDRESKIISLQTGRTVFCIESQKVYNEG
jgi:uncharacterized HAD superfamily protein